MSRAEHELMEGWRFALVPGIDANAAVQPEDDKFNEVFLPHDWAVARPIDKNMECGEAQGFLDRWGVGWYKKNLELEKKDEGRQYYLDFGGIFEDSTVWVNGIEAGGRKYGYSPFRLDVTKLIKDGSNEITVRVNNTHSPVDRWYSGCGIYRTVKLIELDRLHFDENKIILKQEYENDGSVKLKVSTGFDAGADSEKSLGLRAALRLCRKDGTHGRLRRVTLRNVETGIVAEAEGACGGLELTVENPLLWSAEEPTLYELKLTLTDGGRELDCVSMRVGFRQVVMDAKRGMLVNGRSTKLKGVCVHQEAGCRGIAAKKEIWRDRLLSLKKSGCNAIRAAHHMPSAEFLDLCDELGFYVYEECFDKWTGGLYGRYFETEWQSDLAAMIERDRNRTCVVIWGVGNEVENQAQPSMLSILKMLADRARELDGTRPVSCAMNPHFKRRSLMDMSEVKDIQQFVDEADETEIEDQVERVERIKLIAQHVDILACNYQEQWYDLIHEMIPDKLILGTEIYQFFKGHYDQLQNFTIENPSRTVFEKNYCIGGMIWTGIDYLGESMGYPAKGWGGSLIRTNGEKRPSFYMLESLWSDKPTVHFSVMDYSLDDEGAKEHWDIPLYADHWYFPQFQRVLIPYVISTNCESVKLFLNGKEFHIPKPDENHLISGFLPWQPGTVEAVGFNGEAEACRHTTRTPGACTALCFVQDGSGEELAETMKLPMKAGFEKLLTVHAVDNEKIKCFRESAKVRFFVEGEAEIIGVDNGDLKNHESYCESFIHMYRGSASVLLRLTGKPGRVKVSAFADGLRAAEYIIEVGEEDGREA